MEHAASILPDTRKATGTMPAIDERSLAMVEDEARAKTTAHAERRACRSNARRQCVVIVN